MGHQRRELINKIMTEWKSQNKFALQYNKNYNQFHIMKGSRYQSINCQYLIEKLRRNSKPNKWAGVLNRYTFEVNVKGSWYIDNAVILIVRSHLKLWKENSFLNLTWKLKFLISNCSYEHMKFQMKSLNSQTFNNVGLIFQTEHERCIEGCNET